MGATRYVLVFHSNLLNGRRCDLGLTTADLLGRLPDALSSSAAACDLYWGCLAGREEAEEGPDWTLDHEEALKNLLLPSTAAKSDTLHILLDRLPKHLGFFLDVVWVVPKVRGGQILISESL